jgi:imidazolonepropionase-like amidohydrolase
MRLHSWKSFHFIWFALTPHAYASAQDCASTLAVGDTVRYVDLTGPRRPAGGLRVWRGTDGATHFVDETRIVGRGYFKPRIARSEGEFCVRSDGVLQRLSLRIRSDARTVYSQTFTRVGDSVRMVVNGVRTTRRAAPFELPRVTHEPRGRPLEALLLQAALRDSTRTIRFIGGGSATLREITSLSLVRNARATPITLYDLREPSGVRHRLWLDSMGQLFAEVATPFDLLLPAAWADRAGEVVLADLRTADSVIQAAAHRLIRPRDHAVAIVNATVMDVEDGVARPNMTVLLEGPRISSVRAGDSTTIPAGARIIDARGGAVIPGLWDAHAHLMGSTQSDGLPRTWLASGVTSVRDPFADTVLVPLQTKRITEGNQIGPRVYPAGLIDGWYPDTLLFGRFPNRLEIPVQARDSADVRRLIERYHQLGFRWIKFYDALPPHLVKLAIAEAHQRGMRVAGHVPLEMTGRDAIEAGFDEITHAPEAIAYLVNRDLRDPIAGGMSGERAAALDLASPEIHRLVTAMKARGASLDATLCVYEGRLRKGDETRRAYDRLVGFVRLLRTNGVRVAVGTDNSCTVARELELLREAGFTNAELLRMATLDAARAMGVDRELGSIAVGKLADLVILEGNPLEQIGALNRVKVVIKDGVVFDDLKALAPPR